MWTSHSLHIFIINQYTKVDHKHVHNHLSLSSNRCGYQPCVCVKITGDHMVATYLVDTNTHVITHLSIIIISAKISID